MDTTATLKAAFDRSRGRVDALRREKAAARRQRLALLRRWIHAHRRDIHAALAEDLGKPATEVDPTEIFPVLSEARQALDSLAEWARPQRVTTPLYMLGTRGWIQPEPRGLCLIISPWNYPFNLAVGPLVSALAAGNSVILKPSELAPATSGLINRMCRELFDADVVTVFEGGVEVAQALLALPFDHIFFTGSPGVGKIVMKAAAEHLASVTLELGGKSPALVAETANLRDAARRIAVAKFVNCGQTCIAPDYLLVHRRVADDILQGLISHTTRSFTHADGLHASPHYGRIIHTAHFDRLAELVDEAVADGAVVAWDGDRDRSTRFFHPVILTDVNLTSRIMTEEIFGPVLPVLTFDDIEEALAIVNARPKPLALYLFGKDSACRDEILQATSAGTVCLNDCAIQFLHNNLPFGGVNHSGFGSSHGQYGFQTFSHLKPVLRQKAGLTTVQTFYPPYTARTKRFMDWFLRLF